MSQAVIGIVSDLVRTDHLVKRLNLSGFGSGKISVLGPDSPISHIKCEKHTQAAEGAFLGATTGGGLGALLSLIFYATGSPALAIVKDTGPVVPVLCGIGLGTIVGLAMGSVVGLFNPKYEAKQFAGLLKGGNIIVSVHVEDKDEAKLVKELFESAQAESVQCVEENML